MRRRRGQAFLAPGLPSEGGEADKPRCSGPSRLLPGTLLPGPQRVYKHAAVRRLSSGKDMAGAPKSRAIGNNARRGSTRTYGDSPSNPIRAALEGVRANSRFDTSIADGERVAQGISNTHCRVLQRGMAGSENGASVLKKGGRGARPLTGTNGPRPTHRGFGTAEI